MSAVYEIEIERAALDELAALPPEALAACTELMAELEDAPWTGDAYNRMLPEAGLRTHGFGDGERGLVVYTVVEQHRQVSVLRVLWD